MNMLTLSHIDSAMPRRPLRMLLLTVLLLSAVIFVYFASPLSWPALRAMAASWSVDQNMDDNAKPLSAAEEQALVAATKDAGVLPQLVGEEAVKLNEALPFSLAPILAAAPFAITSAPPVVQQTALQCLTQAVYFEAGFESEQGKRAVAQVVLNRMRHPAFPNTVCGVVYEGSNARVCQFSFTCDGSLGRTPAPGAWLAAQSVAQDALRGHVERSVGTATHYHADYVSPYWAPKLTKMVQIGAHIFYRWPGSWGLPSAFGGRYAGYEAIPSVRLPDLSDPASSENPADPTLPLALQTLPANLVPERHAEHDVGGRLDITKGWSLRIPAPSESRGAMAAITGQQAGTNSAATTQKAVAAEPADKIAANASKIPG